MTTSYFRMAMRSLMANKSTTAINTIGLVIGVAAALMIITVLRFELNFDTFHSERDRIYRLVRVGGTDQNEFRSGIPYPVADALKNELSSIKKITKLDYLGATMVDVLSSDGRIEKKFQEAGGLAVVPADFFDVLDFKDKPLTWISGDAKTSLSQPLTIVLTESLAKKYFGNEDPMGQTLKLEKQFDVKVSGVISDFPVNTDFPFTMMISEPTMEVFFGKQRITEWVSVNDSHSVFIIPNDGVTKEELEAQIAKVHEAHVNKDISDYRKFKLQELSEIHFDPRFGNFSGRTITHETVLALEFIVIFLLLAGAINYINLSTAQSTLRSKEIGMRKVMGGTQKQLIAQFITETFVVVAVSCLLAMLLVEAMLPFMQDLINLKMDHLNFSDPFILTTVAAIMIGLTVLSGLYPATLISKFNPISALKSKFATDKVGGFNLRKVLVVAQFTITQILAVGTFIVMSQMEFFRNVDMGFDRDAVINFRLRDAAPDKVRALKSRLQDLAYVELSSASFTLPSGVERNRSSRSIGRPDAQTATDYDSFEYVAVDENFLDLYNIRMIAGRSLEAKDSTMDIVINEHLVESLQLGTAEQALGAQLKINGKDIHTVVGVVSNYYSNSVKEGVDNMVMMVRPKTYRWFSVKLRVNEGESMATALKSVEQAWNDVYPDHLFTYSFFDANIEAFYQQEFKYSKLFQLFSMVFLVIGALGLYGLITFIVNKKGKEIAVRKTLGASVSNIISMFSKEYVKLILLSFALALPVAWYTVNLWLSNFQNHVPLTWWLFAVPGLIVLSLALTVVGTKSFAAARVNPVEKLKNE